MQNKTTVYKADRGYYKIVDVPADAVVPVHKCRVGGNGIAEYTAYEPAYYYLKEGDLCIKITAGLTRTFVNLRNLCSFTCGDKKNKTTEILIEPTENPFKDQTCQVQETSSIEKSAAVPNVVSDAEQCRDS